MFLFKYGVRFQKRRVHIYNKTIPVMPFRLYTTKTAFITTDVLTICAPPTQFIDMKHASIDAVKRFYGREGKRSE